MHAVAKVPLIRGDQIAEIYIYQHDKTSLTQPLSFHRSEDKGTGANQTIQHSRSSHIVLYNITNVSAKNPQKAKKKGA